MTTLLQRPQDYLFAKTICITKFIVMLQIHSYLSSSYRLIAVSRSQVIRYTIIDSTGMLCKLCMPHPL